MINEEAHIYYLNRINSEKKSGYLFNWIPFPSGSPLVFLILNIVLFAFFGVYTKLPILIFIVFFPFAFEFFITSSQRNILLDNCIAMEKFSQQEFVTKGVDPNFPYDPLYVTKSDREDIFDESYEMLEDYKSYDNFKKHYFFILTFTASYIIVYFIFKFGFDF
jgi:hypothetical protein